jgi:hypothetical protein
MQVIVAQGLLLAVHFHPVVNLILEQREYFNLKWIGWGAVGEQAFSAAKSKSHIHFKRWRNK